ncbi:hypothetical protein LIER_24902 [Lithospermum erythrorhizon]|uniref:Uncharacterized protein n=1 Tax=Lithospermum erythrorhizon TaxID=34254 RepID=A0AAV3R4A1_LITER
MVLSLSQQKNGKSSVAKPFKLESFLSHLPDFPLIIVDSWTILSPKNSTSSSSHTLVSNQSSEANLRSQLDLLKSEEEYWRQRSKLTAISEGDRNTKFFHSHVKHKTKINNILELKDDSGILISNEEKIRKYCKTYFEDLFKANHPLGPNPTPINYRSFHHITTTLTPPSNFLS